MAGTLLVECGLLSSSQLAEALEHQRTHGGALDEVVAKLFDLPLPDLRVAMSADASGIDVGAILFATNIIDEETLAEARKRSTKTGQPVGPVLVEMGSVTRLELASALADQWSDSPALILPSPSNRDHGGGSSTEVDDLKFAMRALEASVRAARVTDGSEASLADLASREAELAARLHAVEEALAQPVEVDPAFLAEFQATVRRTHEIEAALAGLAPAEALATFAAAADEVRGLQGALDALGERVERGLTTEAFEPVVARVEELAARVEALDSSAPVPSVEELAELRAVVEELAARPAADPASAEALAGRIEELAATLPELDVRDELAGLRAQLEELSSRPSDGDGLQEALAGLAARVDESASASAGMDQALKELRAWLELLAAQADADRARVEAAATSIGEVVERVAEVEGRPGGDPELADVVTAISVRLDELAERPAGDPQLAEVVAALASRLETIAEAPSVDPELETRVRQLAERVEGLSVDALGPAAAAAVADVSLRVDALATGQAEEAERLEVLRARIEELRGELDTVAESSGPDPELSEQIEVIRAAMTELAERLDQAASADELVQLRAELPTPGLDDESAQRLSDLEQRVVAIGAAAGDQTAVDEIKTRLGQVAEVAETQVSALLGRLDALEVSVSGADAEPKGLAQLRDELSALASSVESVRESFAGEIERLASSWAGERSALEARLDALADSPVAGTAGDGAVAAAAPVATDVVKLAREMERLQDRVVEQERSLVEHFARREKALTERMTGGTDVGQRLAEITRLVDEQRSRIDRLSTSGGGGGGGGGASGDDLTQLKESLFLKLEKLASSIDWRFQRLEGEAVGGSPAAAAAKSELHARVDQLTRVVGQLAGSDAFELSEVDAVAGDVYLALVPTATGHQLVELEGDLPTVGDSIITPVSPGDLTVIAVGTSPLPGDGRACVFVEPVDVGSKKKAKA